MKRNLFTPVITAIVLTLGATASITHSSYAQTEGRTYFCDQTKNPATTMARIPGGILRPLITWQKAVGGISAPQRCDIVSQRFEARKRQLNFMWVGTQRNQPVLCVAEYKDGPCVGILMTLSNRTEAETVRKRLMSSGALATGAISQGSQESVYVDINKYLGSNTGGSANTSLLEF